MKRGRKLVSITAVVALLALTGVVPISSTALAGSFPGVNGQIVYTSLDSSVRNIRSTKVDSTGAKVIISDGTNREYVAVSPDGTKIAYTHPVSSLNQVFVANIDGSNQQQLTTSPEQTYEPSWSPDGTKILFTQLVSGVANIFRMNANGSSQTQVTPSGAYTHAEYSPDGTKILALQDASDDEIVVMNADGTNIVNLTNNSVDELQGSWSPDGTKITYSSLVSGSQEIFTMNADGSNKVQRTSDGVSYRNPVYSPDGTKIAFIDTLAPSRLFTMNPDGTNIEQVAAGWALNISWQPLTKKPSSGTPNPTLSLSGGQASVNIPSLYTDTYEGIDKATVAVTSTPASGTTSVDSTTGVITYTPKTTAARPSFWGGVANVIVPKAMAAGATDSFTYKVCSLANSSLCSTGTVTVNLLSAPGTGAGQPGGTSGLVWVLTAISVAGVWLGSRKYLTR